MKTQINYVSGERRKHRKVKAEIKGPVHLKKVYLLKIAQFKWTVSRDKFKFFLQKSTELGLTKGLSTRR
jgi:hypothetical protein